MKLLSSVVAIGVLSAIWPAQAQVRGEAGATAPLAVTDPLKIIYRVAGVFDTGSFPNAGVATAFSVATSA